MRGKYARRRAARAEQAFNEREQVTDYRRRLRASNIRGPAQGAVIVDDCNFRASPEVLDALLPPVPASSIALARAAVRAELEKESVANLRRMAKEISVKGASRMRKSTLIDAICP